MNFFMNFSKISCFIIEEMFTVRKKSYTFRQNLYVTIPHVNWVYHGSGSVSDLGPWNWNLEPVNLKERESASALCAKLKSGKIHFLKLSFCFMF